MLESSPAGPGSHQQQLLMRPTQYAEHNLIAAILNKTWPPGTALPAERTLAAAIGVTRQTLREALQRLAKDRWITISHGKATIVNDYWQQGGLGILRTMAAYAEYLPPEFVSHLLQARTLFLPVCARAAVADVPDSFLDFLGKAGALGNDARLFAEYDWELQSMMVHHSGNMIYPLILNDFESIFTVMGKEYFRLEIARKRSVVYYNRLARAIVANDDIEQTVRQALEESLDIWHQIQPRGQGGTDESGISE